MLAISEPEKHASQYQGKAEAEGIHVLIGFEDLVVIHSPFGGELTPLPKSGRRSVWTSVAQVINLFLYTLHALKTDKRQKMNK